MWAGGMNAVGRTDMYFHATLARTFINALSLRGDDDFIDRLNYYYTPIMLSVACLIISAKQYGGTPIECWVNPHSRESMEEYIESYCWIQNTYWVPMYENIPDDHTAREGSLKEKQIGYYQWVPFILIAEALMFSVPCIFWRLLSWQSGLNIQHVINAACDSQAIVDHADKQKDTPHSKLFPRSLISKLKCTRLLAGHYVSSLYVVTKLLYALNIVLQFVILNACLKNSDYLLFGFQVLADLYAGKPWTESGHFPRVTLCDFEVRYLANLNRYTVQCALLINIINEKVFAFLWLWYLILMLFTTISTMLWISQTLLVAEKVDYVTKFMQIAQSSDSRKEFKYMNGKGTGDTPYSVLSFAPHLLDRFVLHFLRTDGVFILRMMANHAGDLVVVQIVRSLWREFRERNWREFAEFEEMKDGAAALRGGGGGHSKHHSAVRVPPQPAVMTQHNHRFVTMSNPVATVMSDSIKSDDFS
ncbi:inx-19 [Pristionchus pacificus]|uniref:Innexin n=1 Tax=Pristionchus pacificus TaxID=54126 RepID=A0A2A6CC65_PRIPA|nr:inx-19 [Pristionchus pacificus]|eukprot:PDM75706.1 inx-19 [Pristionchus pacificus]